MRSTTARVSRVRNDLRGAWIIALTGNEQVAPNALAHGACQKCPDVQRCDTSTGVVSDAPVQVPTRAALKRPLRRDLRPGRAPPPPFQAPWRALPNSLPDRATLPSMVGLKFWPQVRCSAARLRGTL